MAIVATFMASVKAWSGETPAAAGADGGTRGAGSGESGGSPAGAAGRLQRR
jgi:hypothetical protein